MQEEAKSWLLEEKKKLAEEGYQEVKASHEMLKARLVGVLTLSVTLCTACYGGAWVNGPWAFLCLLMAVGFTGVAVLCVCGLYPTLVRTKNVEPELIDALMDMKPEVDTKEEAFTRLTSFIMALTAENDASQARDKKFLQWAWVALPAVPLEAFLIVFFVRMIGG